MPTPKRRRPAPIARKVHEWEFVTFRLPPTLKAALEEMVGGHGAGQGEFLRYLVRQEWKGWKKPAT